MTSAAAADTTGAANDVPESSMYPLPATLSGWSGSSVALGETGPIRYRPGAESSGFANPSGVEPHADQGASVWFAGLVLLPMSSARPP